MAARVGRLYTKKSGEGGADASYDGAHKSDFEAKGSGRTSSQFASSAPRFKQQEAAPDVDLNQTRGIAETATGKGPAPMFTSNKPRFQDPKPANAATGDYHTSVSEFDKVKSGPSPMMRTPERPKDRVSGWVKNDEAVAIPPPNEHLPGAFDKALTKNSPSPFTASSGPRFKENVITMNGEPTTPVKSDFEKAPNRPSPAVMSGTQRFKVAESAGDPGACRSAADIERERMEQKIARQRQQAEAEAARAMAMYANIEGGQ